MLCAKFLFPTTRSGANKRGDWVVQPELQEGDVDGRTTAIVTQNPANGDIRRFKFDAAMQSASDLETGFVSQQDVYDRLGAGVLENAIKGFNACMLAYGQTGSGKTHTMMGPPSDVGIIPRLCKALFAQIDTNSEVVESPLKNFESPKATVEASYCEVYNERVYDLLGSPESASAALRVREHKLLGPYVEGLTKLTVTDFDMVQSLFEAGNNMRHTAKTAMNDTSSRSHAIFTVTLRQTLGSGSTSVTAKVSKISLVDLAGSERQSKAESKGLRLKEGSNINKSLSTLGMVIHALAKSSGSSRGGRASPQHVPYRNSTLTWLLKDSFGGNSKTVMVATCSPAARNFEETISTLKYADRAKQIVNKPTINEGPASRELRSLRDEVAALKGQMASEAANSAANSDLRSQLAESEKLLATMNMTWEERMARTRAELLRVAEAAKEKAEAAELESEMLKQQLNVRRHEGRKTLNKMAASFRAKETAMRAEADRSKAKLERQIKSLMAGGPASKQGSGGGGRSSQNAKIQALEKRMALTRLGLERGGGSGGEVFQALKASRQNSPTRPSAARNLPQPPMSVTPGGDPMMLTAVTRLDEAIKDFRVASSTSVRQDLISERDGSSGGGHSGSASGRDDRGGTHSTSSSGRRSPAGRTNAIPSVFDIYAVVTNKAIATGDDTILVSGGSGGGGAAAIPGTSAARKLAPATPRLNKKRSSKLVALDKELVNLDRELEAVSVLAEAEMQMNNPSGAGELQVALTAVRKRASALEARRGLVLSDIAHYQSVSGAPPAGPNGVAPADEVGWRLASAVQTTQATRAQQKHLDLKLQHVFAAAADVARTAISSSRAKGETVVPLLDTALHSVSGLVKELDVAHVRVLDAEQRADTQVVVALRQAGVPDTSGNVGVSATSGGSVNLKKAERAEVDADLADVASARRERDVIVGDASDTRTKYVDLLGELRQNLHTQGSTALTFADVEAVRAEQRQLIVASEEAALTIANAEIKATKAVLKSCLKSNDSRGVESISQAGMAGSCSSLAAYTPQAPGILLHTFEGDVASGQLPVKKGDAVTVVDQINNDWYYCTDSSGAAGLVPCTYVKSNARAAVRTSESAVSRLVGPRGQYTAPIGVEADSGYGARYSPATPALELAYRSALLADVVDEFSALQRHENAVFLVEELRGRRQAELREVWMLAEERRALQGVLRCAPDGESSPAKVRLNKIVSITEQAHQHCKMIASAMAPATARLGRTAQIHRTVEVLGAFAPSPTERLKLLMERLAKLRQRYAVLNKDWTAVRQGWSDSANDDAAGKGRQKRKLTALEQKEQATRLELLEKARIQVEAAKAVVSKAEDLVAREVLHIAASPLRALDNNAAASWAGAGRCTKRTQRGAGCMPMLIDAVIQLRRRLILENATHELLDEKALLLANLLDEERMRLLRTSELVQQELLDLRSTAAAPKEVETEAGSTMADRIAALELHMVESAEMAAALDTGLSSAQRTSREAQDVLAALSAKDEKEGVEASSDAQEQSPAHVLSKIVQGSQRLRLQEGRLTDRFLQAGAIDLTDLGSLPDAIRASGCEDVERLVRVLYTCQLKVTWLTAARSDLKFDLLVEDYAVDLLKRVMLLEHLAGGNGGGADAASVAGVKALFVTAVARRAALATTNQQLELGLAQLQTQHAAMMLKVQRAPEPGSGLSSALVEARMRLNTLLLERAYSHMTLCTARALVVRLRTMLAAKPLLDIASTRKGVDAIGKDKVAIAAAVVDAKRVVAEDPATRIAALMETLQATILSTPATGVILGGSAIAAQTPAALLRSDQVVDPGGMLFEPHACMGNLLHQPANGQPARMLWCVLDTTRKVFEGPEPERQFLIVSSDQTCHLIAPTTSEMQLWIACVGAISMIEPKIVASAKQDPLGVMQSDRLNTVLAKKLAVGLITLSEYNHITAMGL
eukprot:gene11938-26507_t